MIKTSALAALFSVAVVVPAFACGFGSKTEVSQSPMPTQSDVEVAQQTSSPLLLPKDAADANSGEEG